MRGSGPLRWSWACVGWRRLGALVVLGGALLCGGAERAAAEYVDDGRIPFQEGELLELEALPEEHPAREFMTQFGDTATVYWDALLETPRYVSFRLPRPSLVTDTQEKSESEFKANLEASVNGFLAQWEDFFGIVGSELEGPLLSRSGDTWTLGYRQSRWGMRLRGSSLVVLAGADGTLLSAKAFLLRDVPSGFSPKSDAQPIIDVLQGERGLRVLSAAQEYFFPGDDPRDVRPVWHFVTETEGGLESEVFTALDVEKLDESFLHVVAAAESGLINGTVSGHYPEPKGPNSLFAIAPDMTWNEVEFATVMSASDTAEVDTLGDFRIFSEGDSTALQASLDYIRCENARTIDVEGEEVELCEPGNREDPAAPHFVRRLSVVNPFLVPCNSPLFEPISVDSGQEVVPVGSVADFVFNESRNLSFSAGMMAFVHLAGYMRDVSERLESNAIGAPTLLDGMRINVRDSRRNLAYVFTKRRETEVCFSFRVVRPDGVDQWMTPTLLFHEFAHHIVFRLTGFTTFLPHDCVEFGEPCELLGDPPTPRKQIELSALEGVVDGLAAYHAGISKFGFHAQGEVAGGLAYDIADKSGAITDGVRLGVANRLWRLRERIHGGTDRDGQLVDVQDLLLTWLGELPDFQFDPENADARYFDPGPVLAAEISEFAARRHGDAIGEEVREVFDDAASRDSDFIRGDANQDGGTDVSDAVFILNHLFRGIVESTCHDAMDVNDDGSAAISDPIYLLNFLFFGGAALPPPTEACGADPTPDGPQRELGCVGHRQCR